MRHLRSRLLLAGLGGLALGVSGLGTLVGYGFLGPWQAAQTLGCGMVLGSALLVVVMVRRSHRHLRELRRRLDRQAHDISEVAGENRAELIGRADDLGDRMARVEELLERSLEPPFAATGAGDREQRGGGGEQVSAVIRAQVPESSRALS